MNDLRSLVDAARRDALPDADRARMRALVAARIAGGAPLPGAKPAALPAKAVISAKLAAAGALVLGLSTFGAGYWMGRADAPASPPVATLVAPPLEAPPRSLEAPPEAAPEAPTPEVPPPVAPDPAPPPPARSHSRAPAPQADAPREDLALDDTASPPQQPRAEPAQAAPASTLGAELALLRRAQESLRDGDAATALRFVGELDDEHPRGLLAAERDALRILALCAAGRVVEARTFTLAFRREHRGSPHATRVEGSCGAR